MSSSPGSPDLQTQNRFFGLNLGSLWRDLLTAWRGMLEWRIFSWLWPTSAVRLHLPTGEQSLSRSMQTPALPDEKGARSARFDAILLPENLFLRRSIDVPKLQPAELQAALSLEIQTLSPFAHDDVTWSHEITPEDHNALRVHVMLGSRRLIHQYQTTTYPQFNSHSPEVWVSRPSGPGFVILPGFGEARRQRQNAVWSWASAVLAQLVLALIVAIAATPSIQLYLRSVKANQAMMALQQKAGPAVAQREALVRTTEKLTKLAELTGKPVPPLQTLQLITTALPDDTSLISLQIQGSRVSISGQTGNAAALMKQLGTTPGLRDVKAPTPATKPLGAPRESFTIEFTLDTAQPGPAS